MHSQTQFVLAQDAQEQRPWQVFVNGDRLLQINESNPRIRQLDLGKTNQLMSAMDRVLGVVYEVRIVKHGIDATRINLLNTWELSFDGVTKQRAIALSPIRESPQQDLAWLVYLEISNEF
jgi:hypothetical protein